jgi:hypothetical protein
MLNDLLIKREEEEVKWFNFKGPVHGVGAYNILYCLKSDANCHSPKSSPRLDPNKVYGCVFYHKCNFSQYR